MYSNVTTSTRINSSSVHTYIFVCSTLRVSNKGLLTQNATWCQNRGCICISLVRRTYGPIHIPATIILWKELFPKKKEREDPRRDSSIYLRVQNTVVFPQIIQELQDFFEYSVFYSVSTRNPATRRYSTYRINSSTRILQEILQLQGSSRAGSFQQLFPVSPSILHGRIRLPASLQHSRATQHKQASSNSTQ